MPSFRALSEYSAQAAGSAPASPEAVAQLVAEAVAAAHFFVSPPAVLEQEVVECEVVPWEIFHGRLLDRAQTRVQQTFAAWNIFLVGDGARAAEPILSVKQDTRNGLLHVVRAVECYAWEGYDAGGNVYLSREVRKWVRELVGTIDLAQFADVRALHDELIGLLFRAVVGLSRLPLASVEAPLPAFSLGQLAYCYRSRREANAEPSGPATSWGELLAHALQPDLSWLEKGKLLEVLLRAAPSKAVAELAGRFHAGWQRLGHSTDELKALLRTLFNEVALSPYTGFVDNALAFWRELVGARVVSAGDFADFLSYLLRQGVRHLTAYDLITFHHRGANYPDALLLEAALRELLQLGRTSPELFTDVEGEPVADQRRRRLRRRGLRQGWLLRQWYTGLPVPEQPTSPGENARVLPPPHVRVPEAQILEPTKRTRLLYANQKLKVAPGDPAADILMQSLTDLRHPEELQELGMALFLDRPLGTGKPAAEPDQTLLLSYEAFSRSLAARRLAYLAEDLNLIPERAVYEKYRQLLERDVVMNGIAPPPAIGSSRPGAVSLGDTYRVAEDFLVLRTTRQSVRDFLALFDFAPLAAHLALDFLDPVRRLVILGQPAAGGGSPAVLNLFDDRLRRRVELQVDTGKGYARRAGLEFPAAGLRVLRAWTEELGELRFEGTVVIPPYSGGR